MLRILIGFIYAALWFPTTVFIFTEYVYKINGGIEAFVIPLSITGPAVLISIPCFFLVRRYKPIRFLDCFLAGIFIPILILVGYSTVTNLGAASSLAPLCIGVGMISAIIFWVVGVRQTLNSSFYQ